MLKIIPFTDEKRNKDKITTGQIFVDIDFNFQRTDTGFADESKLAV